MSDLSDIETIGQIIAIQNLVPRIAHTADFGTLEEYGRLLAPDFKWAYPGGRSESPLPAQVRTGRDDALRGAHERREAGIQGPGTHTRHVVSSVSVHPHPTNPQSVAYWHFYANTNDVPFLKSMGRYHDEFVEDEEGNWLINSRQLVIE